MQEQCLPSLPGEETAQQRAERLYQRLRVGEEVDVMVPETGKRFTIRPVHPRGWERAVRGYSVVLPDGTIPKGYRGMLLEPVQVREWLADLIET
jgi:hypothetical protein